jgi:hypothetical protein
LKQRANLRARPIMPDLIAHRRIITEHCRQPLGLREQSSLGQLSRSASARAFK